MYTTQLFNNVNNGNNRNIRGNKQRNNIYIYIYIYMHLKVIPLIISKMSFLHCKHPTRTPTK